MQDRKIDNQSTDDRETDRREEQPGESVDRKPGRSGRMQLKDGRHNVWDTGGLDDTQQLLSFLNNPELALADDEAPTASGEPGNPYNSTGGKALGPRKSRDKP